MCVKTKKKMKILKTLTENVGEKAFLLKTTNSMLHFLSDICLQISFIRHENVHSLQSPTKLLTIFISFLKPINKIDFEDIRRLTSKKKTFH